MSTKDWFGIAVRVLGLWTFVDGIRDAVVVIANSKGWWDSREVSPEYYMLHTVAELAAGAFMICGANILVEFCYPKTEVLSEPNGADSDKGDQSEPHQPNSN